MSVRALKHIDAVLWKLLSLYWTFSGIVCAVWRAIRTTITAGESPWWMLMKLNHWDLKLTYCWHDGLHHPQQPSPKVLMCGTFSFSGKPRLLQKIRRCNEPSCALLREGSSRNHWVVFGATKTVGPQQHHNQYIRQAKGENSPTTRASAHWTKLLKLYWCEKRKRSCSTMEQQTAQQHTGTNTNKKALH